jgi:excisionase family DNA binding protein
LADLDHRVTLSVAEACVLTGLSRATLYNLLKTGALPSTWVGARRLIRRVDLDAMLAARATRTGRETQTTREEAFAEADARWVAETLARAPRLTPEQARSIARVFQYLAPADEAG